MEITDELIQKYSLDELSTEDKLSFEQILKENNDLRDDVKAQMILDGGFKEITAQKLKNRLEDIEGSNDDAKVLTIDRRHWLKWAASITLIAAAAISIWTIIDSKPAETTASLFDSYFEPYPNVLTPTTRSQSGLSSYSSMGSYELGNYVLACSQFPEEIELNPEEVGLHLYYGISAGFLNRNEVSIEQLNVFVENKNSSYRYAAIWYKSLFLIKQNEIGQAEIGLKILIDEKSSYSQKAKELQRSL